MSDKIYTVELNIPDITPYREGNTGVDYVTTFDSGVEGPHVMISALVHGNEICGALALDHLFREGIRPFHGKLTLAFVNVAAFERFDPKSPDDFRFVDEDFNRTWGEDVLDGDRDTVETRRAREIRPIVDQADYLLDIHSMQHPCVPLMMTGPAEKGRQLARDIGFPEYAVTDKGHDAGKRMRDYSPFLDPDSPRNALLVECGQHWESSSEDVAIESAYRFLLQFGMIEKDVAKPYLSSDLPDQKLVEVEGPVTIASDEGFRFSESWLGFDVIEKAGTVIGWDGDKPVATPFDDCVLIMPSRRLTKGNTAVRLGRILS